jgi:hypothetical protein
MRRSAFKTGVCGLGRALVVTGIPLGTAPPEAVCRGPAKDAADEHFLPVGAAPQQEQIADPEVWDQVRSRKAIITFYCFYCENSIKE